MTQRPAYRTHATGGIEVLGIEDGVLVERRITTAAWYAPVAAGAAGRATLGRCGPPRAVVAGSTTTRSNRL